MPAAKGTDPGRMLPSDYKKIQIDLPRWSKIGKLGPAALPWPDKWGEGVTTKAHVVLNIAFWKVHFLSDKHDKALLSWDFELSSPVALDRSVAGGLAAPRSLALGDAGGLLRFRVKNLMTHTKLLVRGDADPAACKYVVRVASEAKAPTLEARTKGIKDAAAEAGGGDGKWQERSYTAHVPETAAGEKAELDYAVKLDPASQPGESFLARAELIFDGLIVEHTPPVHVRIAAPPPGAASAGGDVLFFTGPKLKPADFRRLRALCGVLGRAAHFLDWVQFAAPDTGKVAPALWQALRGSASAVLSLKALDAPKPGAAEALVADLVAHNEAGGAVLVDDGVPFPRPGAAKGRKERRVVFGKAGAALEAGALDAAAPREEVSAGAVEGRALTQLLRELVAATAVEGKLALLAAPAAGTVLRSLKPVTEFEQVCGYSWGTGGGYGAGAQEGRVRAECPPRGRLPDLTKRCRSGAADAPTSTCLSVPECAGR